MTKSSKEHKNKVRRITEEEYINYLSSLKDEGQVCVKATQTTPCTREQDGVTTAKKT